MYLHEENSTVLATVERSTDMRRKHAELVGWCFVAIIAMVPLVFYFHVFHGGISSDHQTWAEFGSFFGGFYGPVFSGLAFIVLWKTLLIQKKQLFKASRQLREQKRQSTEQLSKLERQLTIQNSELLAASNAQLYLDYLGAFRDIDARLEDILDKVIPEPLLGQNFTLALVVEEANWNAQTGADCPRLKALIKSAPFYDRDHNLHKEYSSRQQTPAEVHLIYFERICEEFCMLADSYSHQDFAKKLPLIPYYARKLEPVIHLTEDIGIFPDNSKMRNHFNNL